MNRAATLSCSARIRRWGPPLLAAMGMAATSLAWAQHDHGHDHGPAETVERPRVFLDKSPRIVEFQLKRLTNPQLLLVERDAADPKYAPVHEAILLRAGMSRQDRQEAVRALAAIRHSTPVAELLDALDKLPDDPQGRRLAMELTALLCGQPTGELLKQASLLEGRATGARSTLRRAAMAALLQAGRTRFVAEAADQDDAAAGDFLAALAATPSEEAREALRSQVLQLTGDSAPREVRREAIRLLAAIPQTAADAFALAASWLEQEELRDAAVQAMLVVPADRRDARLAGSVAERLIRDAEAAPAAQRTDVRFLDAMQLAEQLLTLAPIEEARRYRQRLRDIAVRVVRLKTIPEEMRYDTPYFAVEAGRPVQVVLQNEDLMPHNFVVTRPGAMREVGEQGSAVANPADGLDGMQYVPRNDNVLFAMPMTPAQSISRLTFTAPETPGEYPYVCTFPRHWMRMYGVMVVVPDLDAWLQDPTEPRDPLGNSRAVVRAWRPDDFTAEAVTQGLRGRTQEIGRRLFTEATCAQCHKIRGEGGAVGPELTGVLARYQGDHSAVLREILDPSHKIDPKFVVRVIQTVDGKTVSGIVVSEDQEAISLIDNPERPTPVRVPRKEIEDMVQSSVSLMPKGLLDRFTQDEILEILNYVASATAP